MLNLLWGEDGKEVLLQELEKGGSMRIVMYIALLFSLLVAPAYAGWNDWDRVDKALFTSLTALAFVDMQQTNYIMNNDNYKELNPVINTLGKDMVVPYFVGSMVLSYFIADALPGKYRKVFLGVCNAVEIYWTTNNKRIGVKISF